MQAGKSTTTLAYQFSKQLSSQSQSQTLQTQPNSQIPTIDLMQHYFSNQSLYKKDAKRSQNLSLGSQAIKTNTSARNNSINNSKVEQHKSISVSQIPQNLYKPLGNQNVQQNQTGDMDRPRLPLSKTSRASQSPLELKAPKQKSGGNQLQKQKSMSNKLNCYGTNQHHSTSGPILPKPQLNQNHQVEDRQVIYNKENIHSNLIEALSQQYMNSNKSNTLPKKIANHPKSARQATSFAHQQAVSTNDPESLKRKSSTLKDKNEMSQFIAQLATKLNQQNINIYSSKQSNESNSALQPSAIQSKEICDSNDTFTRQIHQRKSTQIQQLSTEAQTIPLSSTDKLSCNTRVTTMGDEDDLFEMNSFQPCDNHPNKKGKYTATFSNEILIICSRCAIDMATKGYKIEEIVKENTQNQMKSEMQELLQMITEQKPEHENVLQRISFKRDQLFQFYSKSASLVENTFLRLERELIERKNLVLTELSQQKMQNEGTYTRLDQDAKEILSELNQISSDILLHHDSILQSIELDSFNAIMANYKQKIQIIYDYFADLKSQTIPLMKVSTEFSEELMSQIFQIQHFQTTLLKKNNKQLSSLGGNGKKVKISDLKKELPLQNNPNDNSLMNQLISIEPSLTSQDQIQEDHRAQILASSVYQRIGIAQLLSQQQNSQKQNEEERLMGNESDLNIFSANPSQIAQKTNLSEQQSFINFGQGSNSDLYQANSILPISQTSSIMVKSISNLVNQFGLKSVNSNNLNQQYHPSSQLQINQLNDIQEEDQFKSPDVYHKNNHNQASRYQQRHSVNDTPIAGLQQRVNPSAQVNQNNEHQNQHKTQQCNQQQQLIQTNQFSNEIINSQMRYQVAQNQNDKNTIPLPHQAQNATCSTTSKENGRKSFNFLFMNEIEGQQNQQEQNPFSNQYGVVGQAFPIPHQQNTNNSQQRQQSGAFRTLFSQQDMNLNEEPPSATKSSSGNEKYKNILEKIHANQTRNSTFYSDIIKIGSVSPKIQAASSPQNVNFSNNYNANTNEYQQNNGISVSQFSLQSGDPKMTQSAINQPIMQRSELNNASTFGQSFLNQKESNQQYELDSNNFTVNNSFNDDEEIRQGGAAQNYSILNKNQDYNSTSKFADLSALNNNNSVNFTPQQQLHQKLQISQIYQNPQTESFTQCIQNALPNQLQFANEINHSMQLGPQHSQQLQVVQKSYSQLCGTVQTRESFANNSYFREVSSFDQKDSQLLGLRKQYDAEQLISNQENSNQCQSEINYSHNFQNLDNSLPRHLHSSQLHYLQQASCVNQSSGNPQAAANMMPTLFSQANENGSKDQKSCRDFINFIENKIEEENCNLTDRSKNKSDFRKNLFFSPKFNTAVEDQQLDGNQEQSSSLISKDLVQNENTVVTFQINNNNSNHYNNNNNHITNSCMNANPYYNPAIMNWKDNQDLDARNPILDDNTDDLENSLLQ